MRNLRLSSVDCFKVIIKKLQSGNGYSYTWGCYYLCDRCWTDVFNALNCIAPVDCELDYKHEGAGKGSKCAGCLTSFV
jgi:hypothetical protein